VDGFEAIFSQARMAFKQERVFQKALELAKNTLLTLGKRTITGMLSTGGKMFQDWSAAYRLFEKERINQEALFAPAIRRILKTIDIEAPLFTMMDDTLIRKRGRKVSGANWKRDPLGPAFHTNFVWGQRYLQISAALPDQDVDGRARGVPIDFYHAPSPMKPRKNAALEDWEEYKQQQQKHKVSAVGVSRLAALRGQIPDRKIVCAVDGGFTNKEVFQSIPENTVIIGRIRKDASLFKVPGTSDGLSRGRKRYYGEPLPTPEQIRQNETIPWQKVTAFAAGKSHEFEVKVMTPVRWKSSKSMDMLVVIVRPLAYRPRKGAKLNYRDPAYLICSDPQLPLGQLVQAYLWRWEIELNFRDEKTVIGVGEAQVRTPAAVKSVPGFVVALYAFLLLAAHEAKINSTSLASPKWNPKKPLDRCTTQNILSLFRVHFWGLNNDMNKSRFVLKSTKSVDSRTHFYSSTSPDAAIIYATK